MRKGLGWLVLASVVVFVCPVVVKAEVLPFGLKVEQVLDNANELGNIAESPTGELWVLERAGTIRVLIAGVQKFTFSVPVATTCQGGLLDVAFRKDYAASGHALVYNVDASNRARVDEIHRLPNGLELGHQILDLGPAGDTCRPGGDLIVGKDGKLYIATGDLTQPSEPQSDGSNLGKILRANGDGTVPPDKSDGVRGKTRRELGDRSC